MAGKTGVPVDEVNRTYNSFSGVDMRAVFGSTEIGELQAISYSVTREKAPVYVMGDANPRSFSRGKRGIAGTCIFIMFDKDAVLNAFQNAGATYWANKEDLSATQSGALATASGSMGGSNVPTLGTQPAGSVNNPSASLNAANPGADKVWAAPTYVDEILPFDITIAAANEYGASIVMALLGCELLNEGWGISVDDLVSERQYTFICREVLPWVVKSPASPEKNGVI